MPPINQTSLEKVITPVKLETTRVQSFNEVTQGIISGFNEKLLTLNDFDFGGKKNPIRVPADAVGAIGITVMQEALRSYETIKTPRNFHV